MPHWLTHDLAALAQVVLIDITLAGDNAVVVGLAVAGLPPPQRRTAILLGIGGATVIRIGFGLLALRLLQILGLLLAGGLLLLWVAWRMYRELKRHHTASPAGRHKTLWQACLHILLADVSMSSRQRSRGGRRRRRHTLGADYRPVAFRRSHGRGRRLSRPADRTPALDRLGRAAHGRLRCAAHDLGRLV